MGISLDTVWLLKVKGDTGFSFVVNLQLTKHNNNNKVYMKN